MGFMKLLVGSVSRVTITPKTIPPSCGIQTDVFAVDGLDSSVVATKKYGGIIPVCPFFLNHSGRKILFLKSS